MTDRPSWKDYFTEIVQVTAKRSPCNRLKVGCIIVKDRRIISTSYNGYLPNCNPNISIFSLEYLIDKNIIAALPTKFCSFTNPTCDKILLSEECSLLSPITK